MRKKLIIAGIIITLVVSAVYMLWQVYDLSADYNYASAKMDIASGHARLIHIGSPKVTSRDKEIELVAARYGFKNIYVEKFTKKLTEKGIRDYNDLVGRYLQLRNGTDWKARYQKEVDSLSRIAETPGK